MMIHKEGQADYTECCNCSLNSVDIVDENNKTLKLDKPKEDQIDSCQIDCKLEERKVTPGMIPTKYTSFQRILVVDDEPLNLIALTHNLRMALKIWVETLIL